ncbi:MAG: hypothetical protein QG646_4092, partial [Euryarchaeota archaeon]|nr:hypothetical protein [Euryarchaeota archaeon]
FPLLNAFKVEGAVAKFIGKNAGKEEEVITFVLKDALAGASPEVKAGILKQTLISASDVGKFCCSCKSRLKVVDSFFVCKTAHYIFGLLTLYLHR